MIPFKSLKKHPHSYLKFAAIVFFIAWWSVLVYIIPPADIVSSLNGNGYNVFFFAALIGALATSTILTTYPVIATFIAGGLNPIALGILLGVALSIGNTVYFYFGFKGKDILSSRMAQRLAKLSSWIDKKPYWIAFIAIFAYIGLTPFANNIIVISLALVGYRFKNVVVPLILGNVVGSIIVATGLAILF